MHMPSSHKIPHVTSKSRSFQYDLGNSNRRRKSLCEDLLGQLRQNIPSYIRIQSLKHFIHTLPMTISNSAQPIPSDKSAYRTGNIGYNEPKHGSRGAASNLPEPALLIWQSGIWVVTECFFKDIRELGIAVCCTISCSWRRTRIFESFVIFATLSITEVSLTYKDNIG